jgi:hypothetical protein
MIFSAFVLEKDQKRMSLKELFDLNEREKNIIWNTSLDGIEDPKKIVLPINPNETPEQRAERIFREDDLRRKIIQKNNEIYFIKNLTEEKQLYDENPYEWLRKYRDTHLNYEMFVGEKLYFKTKYKNIMGLMWGMYRKNECNCMFHYIISKNCNKIRKDESEKSYEEASDFNYKMNMKLINHDSLLILKYLRNNNFNPVLGKIEDKKEDIKKEDEDKKEIKKEDEKQQTNGVRCSHIYKSGKNKGSRCSTIPRNGDRCYKHNRLIRK